MLKTTKKIVLASAGFSLGALALNSIGNTQGLKALNTGAKFLPTYASMAFTSELLNELKLKKKGDKLW